MSGLELKSKNEKNESFVLKNISIYILYQSLRVLKVNKI